MQRVYKFDQNGVFIETLLIEDTATIPNDCTETAVSTDYFKNKWDGTKWIEGYTSAEVQEIQKNMIPNNYDVMKKQQADLTFQLMLNGVL